MPTLANPLRWLCVVETERATYRFTLKLGDASSQPTNVVSYLKPDALSSPAVSEASKDYGAQVFLGFARFPVAQVADPNCTTQTLVQFADLRYTEPGSSRGTFALEVPVECSVTTETLK
jgi:hypothetical protein